MKAMAEFRIPARDADAVVGAAIGRTLGGSVRVVTTPVGDATYELIRAAERARRQQSGESIFYSWDVRRSYTTRELAEARLVHVIPKGAFEPEGEECGTRYDESTACPHCGAGRTQISPLSLDLRRSQPDHDVHTTTLRRGRDVARSIADEIVVSDRFVALLRAAAATGVDLRSVLRCRTDRPIAGWHQFVVTGQPVEAVPPTTYGIDPFDLDESGEHRCPLGPLDHVAGLNLLSEITIDAATWTGDDVVPTRQWVGNRVGVLVPAPSILVSGRLYRQMAEARITGVRYEVVHVA